MIEISIKEGLEWDQDEAWLKQLIGLFLEHLFEGKRSLSVSITDDEEIRTHNREQRYQDSPTDILSWSYFKEDPQTEWVGDLMLSLDRVRDQAVENGWDLRTELVRLLAHGCVHLAGWDHERAEEEERGMLQKEKELLEKGGFKHLYPS